MKKLKIILANAAICSGNKGCTALSYTTLFFIDKVFTEAGVCYELYLTDSGHPLQGAYSLSIGGREISYQTIGYPLETGFRSNLKKLLFFPKTIRDIKFFKEVDFILDIGQGDSFSDIYGQKRFNDIDRIHRLARLLKVPYCLLPQTIGPFSEPSNEAKAHKSIADAKKVMARDKISYDYVKTHIPEQREVDEFIDVAFYLPYSHTHFEKDFIHVGLNINALLWNGGYTGKNELGLKDDYKTIIHGIIDYFLSINNVKLYLIPHVVSQNRVLENDYSVSIDIVNEYNSPNLIISPFFFSPVEAKSFISGMDFFMGARMHSTIAAFSSGVPVVPMAYSRKFNGLFGETLNYNHFVDLKTSDSNSVIKTIRSCFVNREGLKQEIRSQRELIADRGETIQKTLKEFFCL